MPPKGDSKNFKTHLRDLDGIIPESIDRRTFFKTAAGTAIASGLAGCAGNGGNGDNGSTPTDNSSDSSTNGDDFIQKNVVYRQPWVPNMSYSVAYITQLQGMWNDQQITPPVVNRGFGSGDTVNRIGNGQEKLGMASITPQISSAGELDFKIYGIAKPRNIFALIYNEERLSSFDDIDQDTRIVATSGLADMSWSMYREALDLPDVQIEVIDDAAALSEFVDGSADAMWRGGYQYEFARKTVGDQFEVGAKFLSDVVPTLGFANIVNGPWLEENLEYVSRVLSGYSHAMKWVCLNPEETVQIMRNDVDQALQTGDEKVQLATLRAGVIANNMTESVRNNGFGYLDTDLIESSIEAIAPQVGVDSPPDVDELVDLRPQEEAELATLSNDEWEQVREFAQPYVDLYG